MNAFLINEKVIKLEEMRHPLLIDVVDEVVANDFYIGDSMLKYYGAMVR